MRVRKGVLYRSANLARASDRDLDELSSLGIKTICDLRSHQERREEPDRLLRSTNIKIVHIPIRVERQRESGRLLRVLSLVFGDARRLDYATVTRGFYEEYVTRFRSEFAQVIRLAADGGNLPILIHCAAGKDRTGYACALIQRALGVSEEVVVQDYLLTNEHLGVFREEILQTLRRFAIFGLTGEKVSPALEARVEYLEAAFERIRCDYGTLDAYFRDGLGLADGVRSRLDDLLLER
jgi:protein-tyrosine phosphatase